MKIVFKKDTDFASDGVRVNTYKAGVVYDSKSSHEAIMFRHFVESASADIYDPNIDDRPTPQETKVAKPRGAK